ncbi:hypothetical protein G6F21_014176 [Rhizopus arrhizus]|nr:hypothetical protein G6F21_014176 [Rhizopus arrhizus]
MELAAQPTGVVAAAHGFVAQRGDPVARTQFFGHRHQPLEQGAQMVPQAPTLAFRRDIAALQAETAGLEVVAAIGQPGVVAGVILAHQQDRQRLCEGRDLAGALDRQGGIADADLDRAPRTGTSP